MRLVAELLRHEVRAKLRDLATSSISSSDMSPNRGSRWSLKMMFLLSHLARLVLATDDPFVPEPALEPFAEGRESLSRRHAFRVQATLDVIEHRLLRCRLGVDVSGRRAADALARSVRIVDDVAIPPPPVCLATSNRHSQPFRVDVALHSDESNHDTSVPRRNKIRFPKR